MTLQIFKNAFEKAGYHTLLKDDILEVLQCCTEFALPIMRPLMMRHKVDVLISRPSSRLTMIISDAENSNNPKLCITPLSIWVARTQFRMIHKFERLEALERAIGILGDISVNGNLWIDEEDRSKMGDICDRELVGKVITETDNIQVKLVSGFQLEVNVKHQPVVPLYEYKSTLSASEQAFFDYCVEQAIENGITDVVKLRSMYRQK